MEDIEKMLGFVTAMLIKISTGVELDFDDIQRLDNIATDLGYYKLDNREFRY